MSRLEVAVLTEDPEGPSARHRWAYPARRLADEGIRVTLHAVEPRASRPAAFEAAGRADLAVVHRKLFRVADWSRLRAAVRSGGGRLVFDLDDAVMYRPTGRRRQWSVLRGLRFARTLRGVSLYLAGNRYLAERAARLVPTVIQPTPIETDRHPVRESTATGPGRVVGWIGTAATLRYLRTAAPALATLAGERDLVLRVIGPEPFELPGVPVEHVPWTEEGEAAALAGLDVGILPLPDDRWTRGKCAFKALQYMAAGLPVVASPVGMNAEVVAHEATGFLAGGRGDWEDYLGRLLDDPELRERMGRAGRKRVEEEYATAVVAARLSRTLFALAGAGKAPA